MKKQVTFIAVLMLISALTTNSFGRKFRVNNTPGVNANYSTLLAAYTASITGDTLYLEGSGIPYVPPDTIKKKLIIIGPGYFLPENDSTQAFKTPASIYSITFGKGSDGSVLTGMNITYALCLDASNLTIARNNVVTYLFLYNYYRIMNNIIIKQNYLNSFTQASNVKTASNVFILNNIINTLDLENANSTYICMNNVILSSVYIWNSEFYNNILNYLYLAINGGNNNIYNNIFAASGTNANGNKYNISMSTVFVGTPNSTDGQYRLKPACPASGAGYNGVDCGAFGNSDPYILSGIPALPHIFDAKVENTGSTNTGLPVHLKAKSQK